MLALKVRIILTLGIMAAGAGFRQALTLECGDLSPLCYSGTVKQPSL